MITERAEEALEMAAKIDGEQSAEEQPKQIAKIDEGQIIKKDEETDEISVQNWLIEALATIKRIEMAQSGISTSCQAFKQLCWPKLHGNVKQHMVEELCIKKARSGRGAVYGPYIRSTSKKLPIPKVPPPEYILGFEELMISFLDDRVMKFIKLIAPKLGNIRLWICTAMNWSLENEKNKAIRQLLKIIGDKIIEIYVHEGGRIQNFNRHFPGIIDQKQIKRLGISPNELKRARNFNIPFNWLMNGQQNDEQKILDIGCIRGLGYGVDMERIKEAFLNDTDRRNWFVFYDLDQPDAEFTMENEKTGEILHLYANEELNDMGESIGEYNLLIRCPKGEEDRWKEEGKKTLNETDGKTHIMVQENIEANIK